MKYDKYIGKKYGRLTIEELICKTAYGHPIYKCKCDCGKEKNVNLYNLTSGATTSCGCYHKKVMQKQNEYQIKGDYVEIKATTSNDIILIDLEDFEKVKGESWRVDHYGYATSKHVSRMHRLITGAPEGLVVDHINHNRLDNRKSNLLVCNQKVNALNQLNAPEYITEYKWKRSNKSTYYVKVGRKKPIKCSSLGDAKRKREVLLKEYLPPYVYERYQMEWN